MGTHQKLVYEPTDKSTKMIKKFLFNVWFFISFYTVFYFYIGAYFASIVVAFGTFILSPLTYYLILKDKIEIAKWLFLISCQIYIYGTAIGLGENAHIEYYFLPSILVSLVFIEVEDTKSIAFFSILPFFFWILMVAFGNSFLPKELVYPTSHSKIFSILNFIGAYAIGVLDIVFFVEKLRAQRTSMIATAKMSSLGEMASGIAHEINNPLSIIAIKTSQLKRKIENGAMSNDEIATDLLKIEHTTKRISKIIKGLKTFARNSEQDPFIKTPLIEIFEDTLELCLEKIKIKQIKIEHNIDPNLQVLVKPTQLSQVFMNLINNSIDAIENLPDPWIKIESEVTPDQYIMIRFTDSGNGIPHHIVEKIMQPFFTTKEIGKGTGLGLSISKGIIEEHKGQFSYDENALNTTFEIKIPNL